MMMRAASAASCAGEVLNVGCQAPETVVRELAELVIRVVGKRLGIEARPPTPGSPARRCPDMSRTARLTGYRARISLEEGMQRTWDWYRRAVFEGGEAEVAR